MIETKSAVNWPMLTASFLVAIMLWLVVYGQSSATSFVGIEVRPQGLDEGRFFIRKMDRRLGLNFRGDPRVLSVLGPDNLVAYVDLSQAHVGRSRYPVRVTPSSLRNLATDVPETVPVELEEVISRSFPIVAEPTKTLTNDAYKVAGFHFDPEEAVVRGPKSEVDKITAIKALVPLDRVNPEQNDPIDVTLQAEGGSPEFARIEPLQARVSVVIAAAPAQRDLLVRANVQGRPADGYVAVSYLVVPTRVTAVGDAFLIASLSQITTEKIDLTGLTATETRTVKLSMPNDKIDVQPRTIRFTVRIERQNLPKGKAPPPVPDPVVPDAPPTGAH